MEEHVTLEQDGNLTHMMSGIDATLFELPVIHLGQWGSTARSVQDF